MREIKFRCWSKERKGIGIITKINFLTNECDYSLGKKKGNTDFGWTSLDNVILMQYTGLKDKNGKEIYEGDILKDDVGIAEVTYDNERAGFYAWFKKPVVFPDYAHGVKDTKINQIHMYAWSTDDYKTSAEVIGNIYENPELIK